MIDLNQLKDKLLPHNFTALFSGKDKEHIHPSEVARLLNSLPVKTAVDTYTAMPEQSQVLIFNYLDAPPAKVYDRGNAR